MNKQDEIATELQKIVNKLRQHQYEDRLPLAVDLEEAVKDHGLYVVVAERK